MAATYGEITPSGFSTLAKRLALGPADKFVDLGSGDGKTVFQAALEYEVASAVGIELAESRHRRAEQARLELGAAAARIRFVCADCASATAAAELAPPADDGAAAVVVWVSNLLFGAELNARVL